VVVAAGEDRPLRMKIGDGDGIKNETLPLLLVEGTTHLLRVLGRQFRSVIEIAGLGHQEDRGRCPEVVLVRPLDGVVATIKLLYAYF
jgi:hypothetical protein